MHKPENTPFPDREVHFLLGLPFDTGDQGEILKRIRHHINTRQQCFLSTPNLNWIVACLKDQTLRDSVLSSDLVVPDGMPLIWIARLLGIPIKERIAGSSLLEALEKDKASPTKVFFFGGPEGVAEAACKKLADNQSGLMCSGFEYPGFGSIDDMSSDDVIRKINASGADFLVVSLGAKKGQAWIQRNRHRITVPVISHLGAVVNFIAGTVSRAPVWMQKTGLEWLWRIKEEPALWQRYLSDGLVFLRLCCLKVLPNIWLRLSSHISNEEQDSLDAKMTVNDKTLHIYFKGACIAQNSESIRKIFSDASHTGMNIRISLKETTRIDSSFLGLLALLHNDRMNKGIRMTLADINPQCQRAFLYSCADFILPQQL